jgi:bifunctional ADP-heptose synthase (sugar kinase/adenylyltransferase)
VLARLCAELRPHAAVLAGDVSGRRPSLLRMCGMDLLCPTEGELRDATGMHDESLPAVAWELLARTSSKAAMVTLGPEGLIAFDRLPEEAAGPAGQWAARVKGDHVPALVAHAVDALGCGDALLSAATLALAAGGSMVAAGFVGAIAAACEAQRLGNIPVAASDLRHGIARIHTAQLAFAPQEVIRSRALGAPAGRIAGAATLGVAS